MNKSNIPKILKERNMKPRDLERLLFDDCSHGTIYKICHGSLRIQVPLFLRVAEVLGLTANDLYEDTPDPDTIEDGFGNTWSAFCPTCNNKTMHVIRPGDARCYICHYGMAMEEVEAMWKDENSDNGV